MIAEIGEPVRAAFGFLTGGVCVLLCIFVLLRSPRNIFSNLVIALTAATAGWNLFEGIYLVTDRMWAMCVYFVGICMLPAVLAHFALSFLAPRRLRQSLLGVIYFLSVALSLVALLGIVNQEIEKFIHPGYGIYCINSLIMLLLGPVMICSVVIYAAACLRSPPGVRGVYGWLLAAAVVGVPCGLIDLAVGAGLPGLRLSNIGALLAACCVGGVVLRHREFFDSLPWLREETRTLLDESKRGLVTMDASGGVIYVNQVGLTLLGERPERIDEVGEGLSEILPTGGSRYISRGGGILRVRLVVPDSPAGPGGRRYLLLEDGTREYELLLDMSHREALASLGEAAATLAHEIQNPLTAIIASLDALSTGEIEHVDTLFTARAAAKRLAKLVTQSLSLARMPKVSRELLPLNPLIERIAGRLSQGSKIRFEGGEVPREVFVDPTLLAQVVENVVRNALEAGAGRVEIATRTEPGNAVIEVRNDGPPIPGKILARLFRPFVTDKPTGTGLGLALCAKLVKAHGGAIEGRNVEGGVVFEVRIPWTS